MATNPFGNNVITQIGILCRDIEKTARAYGDFLGQEYAIVQSSPPEVAHNVYRGEETPAICKQAFFTLGDQVQLELIEPDDNPSVWRDDLQARGEGIHHIAFVVKDTDTVIAKLDAMGMPTLMTGGWGTGRYAYVDARDSLKILLETLENF